MIPIDAREFQGWHLDFDNGYQAMTPARPGYLAEIL